MVSLFIVEKNFYLESYCNQKKFLGRHLGELGGEWSLSAANHIFIQDGKRSWIFPVRILNVFFGIGINNDKIGGIYFKSAAAAAFLLLFLFQAWVEYQWAQRACQHFSSRSLLYFNPYLSHTHALLCTHTLSLSHTQTHTHSLSRMLPFWHVLP